MPSAEVNATFNFTHLDINFVGWQLGSSRTRGDANRFDDPFPIHRGTIARLNTTSPFPYFEPVRAACYDWPMPDLWDQQRAANRKTAEPLAVRLRPRVLDEFVGQDHFLGQGMLLRRMLLADQITSLIFYGPPGTGKTTLAQLIARSTNRRFEQANAAEIGVREVRRVLDDARSALENDRQRTIFFLDEIHRFSRSQQDVLLHDVERGIITLIGATTQNPFFAINAPLVSRSQIFQFQPLDTPQITTILNRAITDRQNGYGDLDLRVSDEAIQHWATTCDGDARRALTALEIAVASGGKKDSPADTAAQAHGSNMCGVRHQRQTSESHTPASSAVVIDLDVAQQSIQRKAIVYDHTGDEHYDAASALIKSMRGSDPDAAVYWLAKMLEAGEDPRFVARRVAILASEDIGNADPRAVSVAAAAFDLTERIGMPECRFTLAQAVIYMATAPKSNASTRAIEAATKDVKQGRTLPVPRHLRDGHHHGAKQLDNGQGYQYAHHSPTGYVVQDYLGVDKTYYQPTNRGHEQQIRRYLDWIDQQRKAGLKDDASNPTGSWANPAP